MVDPLVHSPMDELGVVYNSIPCNARTVANVAITSVMKPQRASASYVLATLARYAWPRADT
jgi:hypothetical protein